MRNVALDTPIRWPGGKGVMGVSGTISAGATFVFQFHPVASLDTAPDTGDADWMELGPEGTITDATSSSERAFEIGHLPEQTWVQVKLTTGSIGTAKPWIGDTPQRVNVETDYLS